MSWIDKLNVMGIRSFDNRKSSTIQFFTPLTLIVGHNGSGKTTIIECLKYATTGELPPNSKGGAFIRDPALSGEKEVVAQVKLSLITVTGIKLVATRSMQLTVKKTGTTFKSLDGSIRLVREGEKTTLSSRVAELNQQLPLHLGVSRAVLDSVIFCHQDESLWPMSDSKGLKIRFDQIFEALKYTSAIENIKSLRKKQGEQLAKFKIIEQHAKSDKDKGERVQKMSHDINDELDELRNRSKELEVKIAGAKEKYDAAWEKINHLGRIVGELAGKRIELSAKQENVQKLKRNLKEMTDSDEGLQTMLEQYQSRVQRLQEEADDEKAHYQELNMELQQNRQEVEAKQQELGSLKERKANHEKNILEREELIKKLASKHNIRGFDFDIHEEQVKAFSAKLNKVAKDQNTGWERARGQTQQDLKQVQAIITRINEQRSSLNTKRESARATIAANDRQILVYQSELDGSDVDEGSKTLLESAVQDDENKLRTARSDFESKAWDRQIADMNSKARSTDERREKLDVELLQATRQAGDTAQLDFLHKEVKIRQGGLESMEVKYRKDIDSVVGSDWQPASVERSFQSAIDQSSRHLTEIERQRDSTSREADQVKFKLNNCSSDLKAKRKELASAEKTIRDVIGEGEPSDYPTVLESVEADRDVKKSDAEYSSNLKKFWSSSLAVARDKKCCRMCHRFYDLPKDKAGLEKFCKLLENEIEKADRDDFANELRDVENDLQDMKTIGTTYDTWERLKNKDIPALEADETRLRSSYEKLTQKLADEEEIVAERQNAKRDIEALSKPVKSISTYAAELSNLERQIDELTNKQQSQAVLRGLEAVQDDLKAANEESRSVKVNLAKVTSDRDNASSSINMLELELRDKKAKLTNATYKLREKASLEKQINNLKTHNNEQRDVQKAADHELQKMVPEMEKAQEDHQDIVDRGNEKDQQLRQASQELSDSVHQLNLANKSINTYSERGGPDELAKAEKAIDEMRQHNKQIEAEIADIIKKVKQFEDSLRDVDETKRQIADNQDYRRDRRAVELIADEIAKLESHNAEDDKERYERESNRWEMQRNKLVGEQSVIMGKCGSKDDELQRLIKEWDTEYKDAAYKYKEAHIKVETTKAAIEDLSRYGGALDKAIMKYHSVKMEEINRIIEELWRKTYQGTDVDSILIRSDNETQKGNKSYNYRVCMVKQDVEMDMRGRCSAGQRVLACIIIRLALAECFGVNCGLIALDEPTTNLDRDNIRALAVSLAEIIRIRRQQKNFQLIIITHDEEFLKYMQCTDFCDHYYRVRRDEEQKSTIILQDINNVL